MRGRGSSEESVCEGASRLEVVALGEWVDSATWCRGGGAPDEEAGREAVGVTGTGQLRRTFTEERRNAAEHAQTLIWRCRCCFCWLWRWNAQEVRTSAVVYVAVGPILCNRLENMRGILCNTP